LATSLLVEVHAASGIPELSVVLAEK